MTCTAMGDNGYYIYFMKTSQNDRLIWSVDDGNTIKETLLPAGTVHSVIQKMSQCPLTEIFTSNKKITMKQKLFGQPYDESNPEWILKGYFDVMYQKGKNYFYDVIENIIKRHGFSTDGAYCNFPDMNSFFEEEHFEGVEFTWGYPPEQAPTIIVSEATCFKYVKLACEKYLQLHPEDTEQVKSLLAQLP
ncbi:ribonuclease toxin immunity protein CdiI [Photorhabdus aegyptia]|uniref:Immunity protein 23 n=1 Tax=Photorhabdus aegyptia TaxID=2805098 RepID=A0A022PCF0_9GAMM|nr:ribonuclease toxin immunity protein CdiI [Photorhabdus aegyptia]EYU13209.1 Immunity protein 23 [Photorhabdus aegyptia]